MDVGEGADLDTAFKRLLVNLADLYADDPQMTANLADMLLDMVRIDVDTGMYEYDSLFVLAAVEALKEGLYMPG